MRRADLELVEALQGLLHRGVKYHGQEDEQAVVRQTEPVLVVELTEGSATLEAGEDLIIPRELRASVEAASRDDTAVVTELRDGRYVLRHIVTDDDDQSDTASLLERVEALEARVEALENG